MIEVGSIVDHWRIVRFLGDGRSGAVYEVRSARTGQCAALKINRGPRVKATRPEFERETDFLERHFIPGCMAALLERGSWNGSPYFVMELAAPIPRMMSRRAARRIFRGAAFALMALHADGFLHCDVKPDNLGLLHGRVVLLDFGSCRILKDGKSGPAHVGTWAYRAPEIREDHEFGPAADIYSLGLALKECCNRSARRVYEELVLKASENVPDKRLQSAAVFLHELESAKDRLAKFKIAAAVIGIVAVGFTLFMNLGYWNHRGDILFNRGKPRDAETIFRTNLFKDDQPSLRMAKPNSP